MSKIIKFPKGGPVHPGPPAAVPVQPQADPPKATNAKGGGFVAAVVRWVWIAVVLVWPVLKWVVSIEVFFQGVRMVYYWNTPGMYAGWTFLLHFAALTALTYFVSIYKPKGI